MNAKVLINARVLISTRVLLFLLTLLLPWQSFAQGFAGLGTTQGGFTNPDKETVLQFPADHGPHPGFRIEWWYVTANLTGADGKSYGLQWTLFRTALAPSEKVGWTSPQLWMGHAAITTPSAHFATERLARGGIGQAGVQATPFSAWIDDWSMEGENFEQLRLKASGSDFAYDVGLTATGPLVLHGKQGYSVKSESGQASHYYSQPFFKIAGTLTLPEGKVAVTGSAWLDREWSSQLLAADQTGWDWFSLSFDTGDKLMGFVLRGNTNYTAATWIAANGTTTPLPNGAFAAIPLAKHRIAGRNVPIEWRVRLPEKGVDVTITALNRDAWMKTSVPYWEGPVVLSGSHGGVGYLEMTGYDD